MARLAAGRKADVARLVALRDRYERYTAKWNSAQLKIDDLVEEGKCPIIRHERERLVRAAQAGDNAEILKISEIINNHMRYSHRRRYARQWLKKG